MFCLVPPTIEDNGKRDFTAIKGMTVTLPCEVSGDPPPEITWTKNGVSIPYIEKSKTLRTVKK